MNDHRPLVVVSHWCEPADLTELRRHCRVDANRTRRSWTRVGLLRRLAEADGLLAFMPDRVDRELLGACPRLRVVAGALKGADNIDLAACTERGVAVSVIPDLLTAPTAEIAVGLTIGLCRGLRAGDAEARSGRFAGWRPILYGTGLDGTSVGIVGFGAVGRAVAARLAPFGARLSYADPCAADADVPRKPLDALLATSRIVIVCAPLAAGTLRLIDARAIDRMPRGAYLVNVGRGSVVDEQAVALALRAGRLGGYAADVFACEDRSVQDRPRQVPASLRRSRRTLFTPHLGSAVREVRSAMVRAAAAELIRALSRRLARVDRAGPLSEGGGATST